MTTSEANIVVYGYGKKGGEKKRRESGVLDGKGEKNKIQIVK